MHLTWRPAMRKDGGLVSRYRVGLGDKVPGRGEDWTVTREVEGSTELWLVDREVENNSTYFWQIAALDEDGSVLSQSRVFTFDTVAREGGAGDPGLVRPGRITEPEPANNATGVSTSSKIVWGAASGVERYRIHFGTEEPLPLVAVQLSQVYRPVLHPNTTYLWRVDPKNPHGITTGEVFRFTTSGTLNLTPSRDGTSGADGTVQSGSRTLAVRGGPQPIVSIVEFEIGPTPEGQTIESARLLLLARSAMPEASVQSIEGATLDSIRGVEPGRRHAFDVTAQVRAAGPCRFRLATTVDAPGLGWASRDSRFTPVLELRYRAR
jgi:hypothetical protein